MKTKDIVAGLGEIGNPILKLVSNATIAVGYDINSKLSDVTRLKKYQQMKGYGFYFPAMPWKWLRNMTLINIIEKLLIFLKPLPAKIKKLVQELNHWHKCRKYFTICNLIILLVPSMCYTLYDTFFF